MRELRTYQVHVELRSAGAGSTHDTLEIQAREPRDLLLFAFHTLRAAEWCTAEWFRIETVEGAEELGASAWQLIY